MPRLKLTKTVVETAQPEKDPYELRDAAIPGFLLKVTPTGRKSSGWPMSPTTASAANQPSGALARSLSSRPVPLPRTGWPTSAKARIRVQRRVPRARRPQ
jgi:hypothetical protein